ncbi:MAG: hypothetical protein M1829_003735 [Trizodia sp. TS-e1964]|nr:MAG: hypothetical protein M1829_003735 [Trizodia sp. TS-e1964]
MLDENLPTFYIRPSAENAEHHLTLYYSTHGSQLTPTYALRHPDPSLASSRNCYAAALFDSYNPEILFGEVLIYPEWTQPTPSADELRRNGGIPPPPQPIVPVEFVIQLYAPDLQVVVRQKPGSWGASPHWEFSLPMETFRQPSASDIDRSQNDPAFSATTPKLNFKWKRDSKLSKDLVCSYCGKSTDLDLGKRNKEPDITIAMFQRMKEVTIFEPNMSRVELQDPKGLEVVLLLGVVVIRDLFLGGKKDIFNVSKRIGGIEGRRVSSPKSPLAVNPRSPPRLPARTDHGRQLSGGTNQAHEPGPMMPDPISQWEVEAETARLKKQLEAEQKERDRAEKAELKRIKKLMEAEDKKDRQRQAEVDKETERLLKIYGAEQAAAANQGPGLAVPSNAPYLHVSGGASASAFFGGPNPQRRSSGNGRKGFLGLHSASNDAANKLSKKKSSLF